MRRVHGFGRRWDSNPSRGRKFDEIRIRLIVEEELKAAYGRIVKRLLRRPFEDSPLFRRWRADSDRINRHRRDPGSRFVEVITDSSDIQIVPSRRKGV